MNTKMLKDPMLYVASILSSFFFGFVESFVGIFNFDINAREVAVIVVLSIVGIFFSLIVYAVLDSTEEKFRAEVRRNTRNNMRKAGWKPPRK